MLTYNGGNAIDHDSQGYSFATNYLSDLGRDIGYSGKNNQVSFYSFNLSLIIIGISFLIYFLFLPSLHNTSPVSFLLSRVGGIFGCFASICFAGVGFTPSDLYFDLHVFFANWVFRSMSLAVFFYSLTFLFINKDNFYLSLIFFFSGLIVLSHIIIADFDFALYMSNPHNAKVLSQKAAVIAMIFMVPLMAIINLRQLNNKKISLRVFG
ncbi:uncharacterized protein METZ01_LOCUS57524 [marine metagenome]|uniref:DUF998 domain-containing protein n=1 Tax=marine metagenome TaxID=408172 RepID=A0A381SKU5_9ZZZZ